MPLHFRPDHEPPSFIVPPASVTTMLGATATLSCTFVGKPTNQVVWYRKGKRVEPSDNIRIRSTDNGSELTIKGVNAAHTGQYTVSIRNPYGEDFASATLAVPGEHFLRNLKHGA